MDDLDSAVVLRAQVKILRLKRRRSWRAVSDLLARRVGLEKLNVKYPFNFVTKNEVPTNKEFRRALGLPRVMPSERPVRSGRRPSKDLFEYPSFRKVARPDVLQGFAGKAGVVLKPVGSHNSDPFASQDEEINHE